MTDPKSEMDRRLERVTREAIQAAHNGRWDQVITCLTRRYQYGDLAQVSPQTARKLLAWDQWIIERVKGVQSALGQQLLEVQDQRRKLASLKRQFGTTESSAHVHHLQTI